VIALKIAPPAVTHVLTTAIYNPATQTKELRVSLVLMTVEILTGIPVTVLQHVLQHLVPQGHQSRAVMDSIEPMHVRINVVRPTIEIVTVPQHVLQPLVLQGLLRVVLTVYTIRITVLMLVVKQILVHVTVPAPVLLLHVQSEHLRHLVGMVSIKHMHVLTVVRNYRKEIVTVLLIVLPRLVLQGPLRPQMGQSIVQSQYHVVMTVG
jgi:hypothetical protein